MNKCMLIGRVTKDPTFGMTVKGIACLTIMLETVTKWINKQQQDQTKVDLHTIVQFGKLAEVSRRNIKAGDLISVEGSLTVSSFQSSEGRTETRNEVKAQMIERLSE